MKTAKATSRTAADPSRQSGARHDAAPASPTGARPSGARHDAAPASPTGARPSGPLSAIAPTAAERPRPLWVGHSGDRWEREADQAALRVSFGLPAGNLSPVAAPAPSSAPVQAKEAEGSADGTAGTDAAQAVAGLEGGGRPLPAAQQAHYGRLFGRDLSAVRLHTGPAADSLTRRFGAAALTSGRHVVMGEAAYQADPNGGPILAHELAHVVQQKYSRTLSHINVQKCPKRKVAKAIGILLWGVAFANIINDSASLLKAKNSKQKKAAFFNLFMDTVTAASGFFIGKHIVKGVHDIARNPTWSSAPPGIYSLYRTITGDDRDEPLTDEQKNHIRVDAEKLYKHLKQGEISEREFYERFDHLKKSVQVLLPARKEQ